MSTPGDNPSSSGRSVVWLSVALIALAVAIAVGSLIYGYAQDSEAEFGGADGQAEEVITEIDDSYEPWFSAPIGELPGEVESGLFALQAGLGGIVLGGAVGWYAGRRRGRSEAPPPATSAAASGPDPAEGHRESGHRGSD
ncbi:energy-coupling factor ABC transporter substrate-binding protein [Gordonia sp. HNM0687]|uniref:Cobalt transport protein CbiN n=1 Tax=Gordonia mangrovi TaxID=2665643 RepID=A0A6L7GT55_9ACTN|nr:energy-coupling factor ABC transporter substrate-binding protein [Gordonia mangrovi]MXP23106.1 energy-coupling factor ABC transporter substrate-binding protein [Gordonia mangrovi]UVF77391.1 energy-coupling factor ABC transporter substrate-binding protein [Gordonia mangrovi]